MEIHPPFDMACWADVSKNLSPEQQHEIDRRSMYMDNNDDDVNNDSGVPTPPLPPSPPPSYDVLVHDEKPPPANKFNAISEKLNDLTMTSGTFTEKMGKQLDHLVTEVTQSVNNQLANDLIIDRLKEETNNNFQSIRKQIADILIEINEIMKQPCIPTNGELFWRIPNFFKEITISQKPRRNPIHIFTRIHA